MNSCAYVIEDVNEYVKNGEDVVIIGFMDKLKLQYSLNLSIIPGYLPPS